MHIVKYSTLENGIILESRVRIAKIYRLNFEYLSCHISKDNIQTPFLHFTKNLMTICLCYKNYNLKTHDHCLYWDFIDTNLRCHSLNSFGYSITTKLSNGYTIS